MCLLLCGVFCFKQKTAYEMRISDWSSDVCSSDLQRHGVAGHQLGAARAGSDGAVDAAVVVQVAEVELQRVEPVALDRREVAVAQQWPGVMHAECPCLDWRVDAARGGTAAAAAHPVRARPDRATAASRSACCARVPPDGDGSCRTRGPTPTTGIRSCYRFPPGSRNGGYDASTESTSRRSEEN